MNTTYLILSYRRTTDRITYTLFNDIYTETVQKYIISLVGRINVRTLELYNVHLLNRRYGLTGDQLIVADHGIIYMGSWYPALKKTLKFRAHKPILTVVGMPVNVWSGKSMGSWYISTYSIRTLRLHKCTLLSGRCLNIFGIRCSLAIKSISSTKSSYSNISLFIFK